MVRMNAYESLAKGTVADRMDLVTFGEETSRGMWVRRLAVLHLRISKLHSDLDLSLDALIVPLFPSLVIVLFEVMLISFFFLQCISR
jgi:hypothetical protein